MLTSQHKRNTTWSLERCFYQCVRSFWFILIHGRLSLLHCYALPSLASYRTKKDVRSCSSTERCVYTLVRKNLHNTRIWVTTAIGNIQAIFRNNYRSKEQTSSHIENTGQDPSCQGDSYIGEKKQYTNKWSLLNRQVSNENPYTYIHTDTHI